MELLAGLVCIMSGKGIGTGFVVSQDGLIVTCAHVLGTFMPEKATVIFQATGEQREALVIAEGWRATEAEDVAFLKVTGALPPGVQSLSLGSSAGTDGHSISAFGYPAVGEVKGLRARGTSLGLGAKTESGQSLLQLNSSEITEGFSGAPVWDESRHRVIGMVAIAAKADALGKLSETAFAIPTETLRSICPLLQISEVRPYRGLKAFTEVDTAFFFGYQPTIDKLIESLRREPRFLAVFGASGCGKSSILQAGLIPRLRKGAILESDHWEFVLTRPTNPSFEQILTHLSQEPPPTHVALIIDQFEELFVSSSETVRAQVATQLINFLEHAPWISLIIVMRNDFYSQFVQQKPLERWMQRGLVNIPSSLERDALTAIIQQPASVVGLRFEEGLAEMITQDALEKTLEGRERERESSRTILPLLEFALTQLWERRRDGMLTREAYEDIGGVTGGLTLWANKAFFALGERQRPIAKRILTDLVHIGNKEQNIPDTRRRQLRTALYRSENESECVSQVIQRLTDARLLVTSLEGQEETVEIIHDALLQEWNQLRGWIDEDRRFLAWRQGLEPRVEAWRNTNPTNTKKRNNDSLLRGHELVEATSWLSDHKGEFSENERAFIQVSDAQQRRTGVLQRAAISAIIIVLIAALIFAGNLVAAQNSLLNSLPVSVTNLNDHGPGSLREAIANASSGGAITFLKTLKGVIKLTSGELTITKNLTVTGPGMQVLSISGESRSSVFHVGRGSVVTISNLSIINGHATTRVLGNGQSITAGGGIFNEGNLVLTGVAIFNSGRGIDNSGKLVLSEGIISYNNNGGIDNTGTLSVLNSTISNNTAEGSLGGGISNYGNTDITGSTLSENRAEIGGGISSDGSLILTNCTLSSNQATKEGGAIDIDGGLTGITYSTIYENTASIGGGTIFAVLGTCKRDSKVITIE